MARRNLVVAAVLMLAALTIVSPSAHAQRNALYQTPTKVNLDGLIRRSFTDYYDKAFPQQVLITEGFFPIGWSRDGKFAYYSEPGDEACGCYYAKLVIKDLKTDAVLYSFDYNSGDVEDVLKSRTPQSRNALWRYKRAEFSAKLKENNIIPQGRFAFLLLPLAYEGDQLSTDLKVTDAAEQEYGRIKAASLQLVSKQKGKKLIYEKSYGEDGIPMDLKVLGYLKSPYEPRIALVLIEVWRGYEGPPHVTHINVVGASLNAGFK